MIIEDVTRRNERVDCLVGRMKANRAGPTHLSRTYLEAAGDGGELAARAELEAGV